MSEIDKLAGRIYTAFITRDITYMASGGMVIAVAIFPLGIFNLAMLDSWAVVIAYAVCSYVLGLLLQINCDYLFGVDSDGSQRKSYRTPFFRMDKKV